MFDTPLEIVADGPRLVLSGSLDESELPVLRSALREHLEQHAQAEVDLSAIDFLPSAGIGVLAREGAQLRERGGRLDLVAAAGTEAQRILGLVGLPHRTT